MCVRLYDLEIDNDCIDEPVFASADEWRKNGEREEIGVGDYIACEILQPGSGTHIVKPLYKTSIGDYSRYH